MPVRIDSFEPWTDAEFEELRRQKARPTNPALTQVLDAVAQGTPVRVPLVEGQSARGLRVAISRAARSRGLAVETLEGDGFVAVRVADQPSRRRARQTPASDVQHRRAPGA